MSTPQPAQPRYQQLADVPTAYFDSDTNTAVRGRQITAKSLQSGRTVIVRVPDAQYTPDAVNAAIIAAVRNADAIAQLGQA